MRAPKIDQAFEQFKKTEEFTGAQSFTVDPDPGNQDAALFIIFEAGWNAAIISAMVQDSLRKESGR